MFSPIKIVNLFLAVLIISYEVKLSAGSEESLGVERQGDTRCYNGLGCLTNNASWFDVTHRPLNFFPSSRDEISTSFALRTRGVPAKSGFILYANDTSTIKKSTFNSSLPTKFIIHGYMNTGYEESFTTMAANLLQYGDYNVITVHWGGGASVNYIQAAANIRLVALEIVLLIKTLQIQFGLNPADVHIIGHSLGAHSAGYVGQNILKLGRITGLDPAGPLFHGMPRLVRLDSSDAQFVDVIHTNVYGFGLIDESGHVDFYINGGDNQPECSIMSFQYEIANLISRLSYDVIPCSHGRAVSLFNDALLPSRCQSVGYQCASSDEFNQGDCASCGEDNTRCALFGMRAESYPSRSLSGVRLFLNTAGRAPFCRFHYAITVSLATEPSAKRIVNGNLQMSLDGSTGDIAKANLIDTLLGENLVHGKSETFLYTDATNIGSLKSISLKWNYVQNPLSLCVLFCNKNLYVSSVAVVVMNGYNAPIGKGITLKSCLSATSSNVVIPSGATSSDFKVTLCQT